MTPFASATTSVRAAQGIAVALAASALFLLVASNVLLLGLRLHDGGLHWSEIATGWPRYGADTFAVAAEALGHPQAQSGSAGRG